MCVSFIASCHWRLWTWLPSVTDVCEHDCLLSLMYVNMTASCHWHMWTWLFPVTDVCEHDCLLSPTYVNMTVYCHWREFVSCYIFEHNLLSLWHVNMTALCHCDICEHDCLLSLWCMWVWLPPVTDVCEFDCLLSLWHMWVWLSPVTVTYVNLTVSCHCDVCELHCLLSLWHMWTSPSPVGVVCRLRWSRHGSTSHSRCGHCMLTWRRALAPLRWDPSNATTCSLLLALLYNIHTFYMEKSQEKFSQTWALA